MIVNNTQNYNYIISKALIAVVIGVNKIKLKYSEARIILYTTKQLLTAIIYLYMLLTISINTIIVLLFICKVKIP